jgi:type IV pilus assembly protein PilC
MAAGKTLPLAALVELCRSLRHYLGAGLSLVDVFRQQATRGPAALRGLAGDVAGQLEQGSSLEDALKRHKERFPAILPALARVGERSGKLPEVFRELEKYFRLQQQLRRQFWAQVTWPLIQFVLAVFILAGMLFVLGMLNARFDPLGLGLTGTRGAVLFLAIVWGTVGVLAGTYLVLKRVLRRGEQVDRFLLRLPVVGPCLRALALHRLCVALRMTTDSGMSVGPGVRLALRATGNEAFAARADAVADALKAGEELTAALGRTRLLPPEFLNVLANAEEAGRIPEVLEHEAEHYEEESRRRLSVVAKAAGYGVWAFVGLMLVVVIFRLWLSYFSMFDQIR